MHYLSFMDATKKCEACGTTVIRTGSRGAVKKLCPECYKAKESSRKKQSRKKHYEAEKLRLKLKRKESRDLIFRTTCKTCGTTLQPYAGRGKQRIFCSTSCARKDETNKQKRKAWRLNWLKANPEKALLYAKRHDETRDPEKRRARARRLHEKYSSTLADPYIKHLLTQGTAISKNDVPQSLVDLKRVQVQITRKLKELNDAASNDRD